MTALRPATHFELINRQYPITVIITENGDRFYIHGYPKDIIDKLQETENGKCKKENEQKQK